MFPNKSSSYEISSKTNAFVQNNDEEDKSESLRGMAQPLKPTSPTQQVPDKRDVMVVETGVRAEGDPVLTVIANHPSQAPAKIPSSLIGDSESDGSSKMPLAETRRMGALCLDSIKSSRVNDTISSKDKLITFYRRESSTLLSNIPQPNDDTDQEVESFKICDYYTRWGIPPCFKLLGGGESSLTTGTTGWGSPPNQSGSTGWNSSSSTSGGNNTGGQSGQGGTGQSPASASGGQSWGNTQNNANNSANSNNNNGSRNSVSQQGGSGGAQQQPGGGPPSQSTASPAATVPTSTVTTASSASSVANTSNNNTTTTSTPQQNGSAGSQQGSGSTWAAAAGKGLPPTSTTTTPTSTGNTSTKQQMEQLNTMREALYSQDGWGGQNVNQDSNWDIPGSPEPGSKDSGSAAPPPLWKLPINNGTDLWEANLRNGGLPPPASQQSQKTPWGHTPSSNIGGTWGEEDEGDASNVWTGVPQTPAGSGPQWPAQPPPIWPGKKEGDWSGPNWNDQRGDPRDLRHSDMRQMMDARDHIRPTSIDHRSMGGNDLLLRGDPRGITGRLNGVTSETMWPGPAPHHHIPHNHGKLPTQPNQAVNQWGSGGGPPMKDMAGLGGKSTGWEEPSPPAQRRNMPNYDDGTSLWGGPQHPRPTLQGQNKVSHWKEMPAPGIGRGGLQCPPGRTNPSMKPDQPLWAHHRNGGGWAETGMDGGPWGDEKPTASAAPWVDQGLAPSSWQGGPKHKPAWDGSDLDPASWGHSKQASNKAISKELIWTSKQFRILSDMGFKKEDIENALRSCGMVLEDALDQLNTNRSLERWPRHTDLDPEHAALMNAFPSPQQTICLTPFPGGGSSGSGAGGPGGPTLATITPAVMQKLLAQQPPQQQPFAQQSSRTQQTQQPSAQQLRMLVQQIQMAVQGGYLSPQILNQPLAPQTLLLLNQLLQQIKQLQQLLQHHNVMQVNPLAKPSNNHLLQLTVQITKTKQQITNLQNQIAAQQAVYMKHQQQTPQTNDFFKTPLHEPISALHSNFSDLTLKEPQTGGTSQQSRLNQWKLPTLDKDSDLGSGGEFSRAPGTTAKSAPGSSSPNTNLLLGQADGTWSTVNRESGWPDSAGDDSSGKDWPNSSQPPSQAFSDLVPEFEPGKPWKGNPLKTIEDDPSLTPGSVVRSPLSMPAIKDSHILSTSTGGGKASPTTSSSLDIIPSLGLTSSTWSFNPPPSSNNSVKLNSSGGTGGAGSGSSSSNSAGKNSASTWENSSELWAPKRGPPPGLPAKPNNSSAGSQAANGWGSALSSSGRWPTSQGWPGPNQQTTAQPGSTWLLLRNLTPQIDGSTLKTLCLQHGPLQNFHLYLNHGIALAKYTSREEANKAQGALNNCVLGNTTIFAESPSESDVLSLLQHLGGQGGGSGSSAWRGKEPWGNSQLWGGAGAGSGGASLWAGDTDQHRNTPSSINSFLPGDLLGGESI